MTLRTFVFLVLLACLLSTAGCTDSSGTGNQTGNFSENPGQLPVAKYQRTLAQPLESSKMVRMETDVYNIGEVVEFVITNDQNSDLSCLNDPPSFSVRYQKGGGQWVTRMGEENPSRGATRDLKPGESTAAYRFVTDGWVPGRYRIVTDCGVSREILLRALPSITPSETPCVPVNDTSPFIRVNPISNQYTGDPFRISGTTSLAAGQELRYSIFALIPGTVNITSAKLVSSTTTVTGGSCGINTWFVEGVVKIPGDYFIGISTSDNTVSAVKRFTVTEKQGSAPTQTLPEKTIAPPGISTG